MEFASKDLQAISFSTAFATVRKLSNKKASSQPYFLPAPVHAEQFLNLAVTYPEIRL
jgi:hypothetical protein